MKKTMTVLMAALMVLVMSATAVAEGTVFYANVVKTLMSQYDPASFIAHDGTAEIMAAAFISDYQLTATKQTYTVDCSCIALGYANVDGGTLYVVAYLPETGEHLILSHSANDSMGFDIAATLKAGENNEATVASIMETQAAKNYVLCDPAKALEWGVKLGASVQ